MKSLQKRWLISRPGPRNFFNPIATPTLCFTLGLKWSPVLSAGSRAGYLAAEEAVGYERKTLFPGGVELFLPLTYMSV